MKELIKELKKVNTYEKGLELIENCIKPTSWYDYLRWDKFDFWGLMLRYDRKSFYTIIWKDGTPPEEIKKGAKVLLKLQSKLIVSTP